MAGTRHDIRTPAPDKFGKPGSSFPYGTQDFPRVVEEATVRKGKTTFPFLTPHPDNSDLLLVGIQRAKGDDTDAVETRVYECVPGPQIISTGYNDRGENTTTITRTVLTNDDPPVTVMGYLYDGASKAAQDALRSTLTVTTVDQRKPLYQEDVFTTNRSLMRHITGTPRTTYTCIVPIGTDPDSGFFDVESSVKDLTVWQALKTRQQVKYFTRFRSTQSNAQWGGMLTETYERLVSSGTQAKGTITLNSNPSAGDTVTINDQINGATVFTFRASVSASTDVLIGVDATSTAANLSAAIDAVISLDVHATNSGAVVTVSSNGVGTLGNSVTLAKSSTAIALSGSTLTGGAAPTPEALSATVLSSSIEDYDGTHALQTIERLVSGESFPTYVSQKMNDRLGVIVTESRTLKAIGSITPGYTIAGDGSSLTVVEKEPYPRNKNLAWEVTTVYPLPPAHSFATAIKGTTWEPARFPARGIGYFGPTLSSTYKVKVYEPDAIQIPATTSRWYVFSDTPPTMAVDEIVLAPAQLLTSIHTQFPAISTDLPLETNIGVLHDPGEGCADKTVGSSPTFSEYFGLSFNGLAQINFTSGSAAVTGTSSKFLTEFSVGDVILVYWNPSGLSSDWKKYSIASITDDTHLTLDQTVGGTVSYIYFSFSKTGTGWFGNEKIRKAQADRIKPGLYECNAISYVMR